MGPSWGPDAALVSVGERGSFLGPEAPSPRLRQPGPLSSLPQKDLPQSPWAPASADGPQPQADSDATPSRPPPGQEAAPSPPPAEQPPEPSAPEESGAGAPPRETESPTGLAPGPSA